MADMSVEVPETLDGLGEPGAASTTRTGLGRAARPQRPRRLRVVGLGRVEPPAVECLVQEGSSSARARLRNSVYRRSLVTADAAVAVASCTATAAVAGWHSPAVLLGAVGVMLLANKAAGLYDRDDLLLHKATLDEVPSLFQLSAVYALVVWLLLAPVATRSPLSLAVLWGSALVLLIAGRLLARRYARAR